jgi:hypothetical protein
VSPDADGGIRIDPLKDSAGELIHWQEIGPFLYRQKNGQDLVGFRRDATGRMVLSIDFPFFIFQPVGGLESKGFNSFLFIASAVLLVLVLILWPIAGLVRKHYGQKFNLSPRDRRFRFLAKIVCVIDIVFILAWIILASRLDSGVLSESLDPWIHLIQIIGVLGCVGALVAIYNAYRSWSDRGRWIWAKFADALVALACLSFAWLMLAWDLLNFNLNF